MRRKRKGRGTFRKVVTIGFVMLIIWTVVTNCSFTVSYNMSSEGKKSWIDRTFEYGKKAAEIVNVVLRG